MKLLIREYLSLLKESEELDRLLPDLLLAMDIQPISRPQVGVRQSGVDVAAVGKDEQGKETLFLITVKRGDITRTVWDTGPQSVSASLNEIRDVYCKNSIDPKHKKLPRKIILCTGGDLKQEVEPNWNGYIHANTKKRKVEYQFWGGDKLSGLVEKYLFNEHILPPHLRSKIRKVLALLGDTDYNLSDYYEILDELLLKTKYPNAQSAGAKKKILKVMRTINLCQNIIYFWAKNENNLKPALLCAERTSLVTWEFLRGNDLTKKSYLIEAYLQIYGALIKVYSDYFSKVRKHCYVPDSFSGYSGEAIQEMLTVYEQLGFLSTFGLLSYNLSFLTNDKRHQESAKHVLDAIKHYINNHYSSCAPLYDGHVIEISATLYLMSLFSETEFIEGWIREIIENIVFAYRNMNKYFPIESDSYDDLVALCISGEIPKERMFGISTLLPILAQWCIVLGLTETYFMIQKVATQVFPKCTLQIWYPDTDTDKFLYSENAAYKSGAMEAPIVLEASIDVMKDRMKQVEKNTVKPDAFTSVTCALEFLPMVSSRHYRTPPLPIYWRRYLDKPYEQIAQKEKLEIKDIR